jgi:hypothetical protein
MLLLLSLRLPEQLEEELSHLLMLPEVLVEEELSHLLRLPEVLVELVGRQLQEEKSRSIASHQNELYLHASSTIHNG